jgi:hypothetical protein
LFGGRQCDERVVSVLIEYLPRYFIIFIIISIIIVIIVIIIVIIVIIVIMFGDDSKLRLRKSHATITGSSSSGINNKSLDCEEGGIPGGSSGGSCDHQHHHHHHHNNMSNNNNNSNIAMISLHGSGSSGLNLQGMDPPPPSIGQIKGKRVRRRRRKVLLRYCRLCLSGMTATLLSATLSIMLLPFSWVQVDYHHQVQHEFEYVYQVLVDNRRRKSNYQTILRGIHRHEKQIECPSGGIGFENDDYCDCLDENDQGFDEPKTSACSNGQTVGRKVFQCHQPKDVWIFASRVADGIRDCPDGSDEL